MGQLNRLEEGGRKRGKQGGRRVGEGEGRESEGRGRGRGIRPCGCVNAGVGVGAGTACGGMYSMGKVIICWFSLFPWSKKKKRKEKSRINEDL